MAENERDISELAAFAHDHHVHFDVQPDVLIRANDRVRIGFEVRLWAVHARGARALPGCDKCLDLVAELRRLAEWAIPSEHRPTRIEIEPFRPALYESQEVAGADEIALCIRLAHREGWDQPIDACEERCLKDIRQRLRSAGVRER
jgi:hypothetical protein